MLGMSFVVDITVDDIFAKTPRGSDSENSCRCIFVRCTVDRIMQDLSKKHTSTEAMFTHGP